MCVLQVSRVLHKRLVYRRQEGDLPLLSRESRSQTHVPYALGEAPHDVRPAFGLAAMVGVLAAHHTRPGAGDQLGVGAGMKDDSVTELSHPHRRCAPASVATRISAGNLSAFICSI